MENLALIDNGDIKNKIRIIMGQTNYTEEQSIEKLQKFNFNEINVIKDYMGIVSNSDTKIKSVNQCIYKQLRGRLDGVMKNYHERVDNGEVTKIV
jgi:hypothetical protein